MLDIKRTHIFICITLCQIIFSIAQPDNRALYLKNTDTVPEKTIYFNVTNFNFFKNNEYFGPIADGYTLFGTQLNPQLGFQLTPEIKIETGIFYRTDFGNNYIQDFRPTFTFQYQKKWFSMLFGNLNGGLNHNLLEPIYNFERAITNRLEQGAQFIVKRNFFELDAWVDWQNMIYNYSNTKEKIWGGLSSKLFKYKKNNFSFHIPFQFTAYHEGGQIDTVKSPSFINISGCVGVHGSYFFDSKILEEINISAYTLHKKNGLYTDSLVPLSGDGFMINAELKAFKTDFMLSYWNGNHFNTDFGGYLYASRGTTVKYAGTYQNNRQLLILRVTKSFELAKDIYLTLRAEPNYDIGFNRFDYWYGLFLSLNKNIFLKEKSKTSGPS